MLDLSASAKVCVNMVWNRVNEAKKSETKGKEEAGTDEEKMKHTGRERDRQTKVSRVCLNCVERQITLEIECKQWDTKRQMKDVHCTLILNPLPQNAIAFRMHLNHNQNHNRMAPWKG